MNHLTFVKVKSVKNIYDILRSVILSGFILLFLIGGIGVNDNSSLRRDTHGATLVSSSTTDLYSFATSTERCFENLQRVPSSPSKASFGDYLSVAYL
ncbi:MAG: hypothetical protein KF860_12125, partial [Cyclobacteriaceae bacterium]|nr:hypothetical protein [Cyclobacteriaceae bacterium]